MNKKLVHSQEGFATLIALVMVTMLTLLGLAALSTSEDETAIAGNQLQETRAFYAAEAGLDYAAALIQTAFDSTGAAPSVMPSGNYTLNHCSVNFSVTSGGAPVQQALTSGTLNGLSASVSTFSVISNASSLINPVNLQTSVDFKVATIPIFQFAAIYDSDLEIAFGNDVTIVGRIRSNSNLYIQTSDTLIIGSYVSASGNIVHGRKGPGSVDAGEIKIRDPQGNYISMKDGSGFLDSQDAYWFDSSVSRWGGRVQDDAHGQERLNIVMSATGADPHKLIEPATGGNVDSYENLASLKFSNNKAFQLVGGVWSDVTADMTAKGIITVTNNKFFDAREAENVDVTDLDISLLYIEGYGPSNGIIYFTGKDVGGSYAALRLLNGSTLDSNLTIASEHPVYIQGNYNSVARKPAAILSDAVTILSTNWNDANSALPLASRNAGNTTVNVAIVTGNIETTVTDYNGGLENLTRLLEDWNGDTFTWTGSMVSYWNSQRAIANFSTAYFNDPTRAWSYDTNFDDLANMPPATPSLLVFFRAGWSQEFVGYETATGP